MHEVSGGISSKFLIEEIHKYMFGIWFVIVTSEIVNWF